MNTIKINSKEDEMKVKTLSPPSPPETMGVYFTCGCVLLPTRAAQRCTVLTQHVVPLLLLFLTRIQKMP